MVYNASIPQSTDIISNSQSQLLENFGQLNTQFGIDHINFVTGTGFHKKITLPDATSPVPTAATTAGVLYSILDSANASQLSFVNKNNTFQLTGSLQNEGSGQFTVVTPWGLVLKWGVVGPVTSGSQFNYITPFPNGAAGIVLTVRQNSGGGFPVAAQVGVSGFIPAGTNINGQTVYFFAWGT